MEIQYPYFIVDGKKYKHVTPEWIEEMSVDQICGLCSLNYDYPKSEGIDCAIDEGEWAENDCSCCNEDKDGYFVEIVSCDRCDNDAVWFGPYGESYCDECVPRFPCSCISYPIDGDMDNICKENLGYEKDDKGRYEVCADYMYHVME